MNTDYIDKLIKCGRDGLLIKLMKDNVHNWSLNDYGYIFNQIENKKHLLCYTFTHLSTLRKDIEILIKKSIYEKAPKHYEMMEILLLPIKSEEWYIEKCMNGISNKSMLYNLKCLMNLGKHDMMEHFLNIKILMRMPIIFDELSMDYEFVHTMIEVNNIKIMMKNGKCKVDESYVISLFTKAKKLIMERV